MSSPACRVPHCSGALEILLETGGHPVSNGYIREGENALRKPLTLARCPSCGLLQLPGTFAEAELAAAVPNWVRYNEPEAHLDEVAALLANLMEGDTSRSIAGLTYIDQSLQDRLKKAGWESQSGLDVLNGADVAERCSIEQMLAGVQSGQWGREGQKVDLLLARHVFDHTRDTAAFLQFIRASLSNRGLVVFEVPSSIADIEACNPLMLWESHANYFTPATFLRTLEAGGLKVELHRQFTPGGPPVLVAVCSVGQACVSTAEEAEDVSEAALKAYVAHFAPNREALRAKLAALRKKHPVIAMLGAGHIGNLFLNLHDLGGFLDCATDDDARKSGLLLPGSQLPIRGGATLAGVEGLFVLMAVNPAVEERVIERWRQQNPSAVFGSIFPQSPRSVLKL